jgi:hypothetical protein
MIKDQTHTQESIEDLAREALDAAALCIQDRLGVETGDLAALFFSGITEQSTLKMFEQYIKSELINAGLYVPRGEAE